MADTVDKKQRSQNMVAIKSRGNRTTELRMAAMLRKNSLSGWKRHCRLEGTPDFCWEKKRIVLFVDGCFWHGCPFCYKYPKSNIRYWKEKVKTNRKRDQKVTRLLRRSGWKVVRVWECKMAPNAILNRFRRLAS